MRLADRMGCAVVQGYGLTETSPVTNADYAGSLGKPGTIGPSVADTEERVVDLETGKRDLRPNELGELLVRGPQVMKGYLNQPDATAEAIEADGWFHTGDIARMDEDGYVQIVDRKKELIKYKGFQVAPAELEALLLEHPSVADVAVIPKPDIEAGEIPKAFVVSKPGATTTTEDLMAFVATRVATFKQVRELEMIQEIPKNASGKLLRRVLVDLEAAKSADSD
jgi:acyl-CoA synthetase (AMP-forming)/AMP-acid ligase II